MKVLKIKGFRSEELRACNFFATFAYNVPTDLETVKAVTRLQKKGNKFSDIDLRHQSEPEKIPEKTIRATHWAEKISLWKSIVLTEGIN